jgi:hypothetical protein
MAIQIGVSLCRRFFALGGEMNEHKISTLGVTRKPRFI